MRRTAAPARASQCPDRALFGYSGVYQRLDGGQAELVRVPMADRCLRILPDAVSDEAAVFVADMLPTGYSAVRRADLSMGDVVVVVGCGTVGLMAIIFATRVARTVIAVDGIPARRALAERFGARPSTPDAAADAIAAATDGLGADGVIEAAGSAGALTAAIDVRARPGHGLGGRRPLRARLPLEQRAHVRAGADAARHVGSSASTTATASWRCMAAGAIDPTPAITHRFALADAAEAYRVFDAREAVKVLLTP